MQDITRNLYSGTGLVAAWCRRACWMVMWTICFLLTFQTIRAGEILFVRHGETVANETGNYSDATVNRLTRKGHMQTEQLIDVLRPESIDYVVTSPALRCLQTAVPYLHSQRMRAAIWPELEEISNRTLAKTGGTPELHAGKEIEVPPNMVKWFGFERNGKRHHYQIRGKEDGLAQIKLAASRLRASAKRSGVMILVVGHSIHGSRLLEELTGQPMVGKLPVENGAVSRITVDRNGVARIVTLNGKPYPAVK